MSKKLNVKEAEVLLRESMEEAIQQGWTIARWVTCDAYEKICCPIGAWGAVNNHEIDNVYKLARLANINVERATALMNGFDDRAEVVKFPFKSWFILGQKLAREYHASNFYRERNDGD